MPMGLPACLEYDDEAFARLCKILGIVNRSDRLSITKSRYVKASLKRSGCKPTTPLKTADRIRFELTTFYSLPEGRRNLWQQIDNKEVRRKLIPGRGADLSYIPSLEQRVLSDYYGDLFDTPIGDITLSDCEDFFDSSAKSTAWKHPALAVLVRLRNDILRWDTLDSTRHNQIVLVSFAVATILDDVRLIVKTAGDIDVFAHEFRFILDHEPDISSDIDQDIADLPFDPDEILADFRDTCYALRKITSTLIEKPSVALFDKFSEKVDNVLQLREPVLTHLSPNAQELLADVEEIIIACTEAMPDSSSLLDGVYKSWEQAFPHQSTDIEELQSDVTRVLRELPQAIDTWSATIAEADRLQRECIVAQDQESIAERLTDQIRATTRTAELYRKLVEARQGQQQAIQELVTVASPTIHEPTISSKTEKEQADSDEKEILQSDVDTSTGVHITHEPDPALRNVSPHSGSTLPTPPTVPTVKDLPSGQRNVDETDTLVVQAVSSQIVEEPKPPLDSTTVAFWNAIARDRLGIAYHIVYLTQDDDIDRSDYPPLGLIAAAAIGNYVHDYDSKLVQPLAESLSVIGDNSLRRDDEDLQDTFSLMLVSATLFPALFAPATGALPMLRRFEASARFAAVYDFVNAIVQGAEPLQATRFGLQDFQGALDDTAWRDRLDDHTNRIQRWRTEAAAKRLLFGPAQMVWKIWNSGGGILNQLSEHCCSTSNSAVSRVQAILGNLDDEQRFKELVRSTDRNKLKRKTRGEIDGRALAQLRGGVDSIIGLAREWLRLIEGRPNPQGFMETRVRHLGNFVAHLGPRAIEAIDHVHGSPNTSLSLSAVLTRSRASISALINLFDGDGLEPYSQADTALEYLSRDLIFVTELDVDTAYDVVQLDPELHLPLLMDSDSHAETLKVAFDARLARGDLAGATFACQEMGIIGDPKEDSCRLALEDVERRAQHRLTKSWFQLTEEIEICYYFGALDDGERARLVATLPSPASIVATGSALVENIQLFEYIRDDLDHCQKIITASHQARLDAIEPRLLKKSVKMVSDAIEAQDWRTVAEQLERLENNEAIVDLRPETDPFRSFMDTKASIESIIEAPDRPSPYEIITAARSRTSIAGVDFTAMSKDEADEAAQLLATWYEMAQENRVCKESVSTFLTMLGLSVEGVETKPDGSVLVTSDPIRQRTLCPLHTFGSSANGKYRIVSNWRKPAHDFIIQSIGDGRGRPTIVFHFGHLGRDRERLRRWATHESQRHFLVVDDTLVLFLAATPSGRLPTLVRCSAPFTASEPFVTTSSLVPPEVFFGRSKEREEVMDRYGSCFVYGGRQIGKTALLRSVEAQFNEPEEHRLARWIDLKSRGIGEDRQPEDIWRLLWRELSGNLFFDERKEPKGNAGLKEDLIQAINDWMREYDEGRILLLLDEADKFLELDGRADFAESTSLKGLMEDSDRRFKVVFSGLHNVLRTTERANHPLIHLGNPLCIEPLISNGEWQEARQLITEPLAVVGCHFDRDNIVTHILAHTNYFPSLIQLCGDAILEYLRDSNKSFPYEITVEDVYTVFSRDELRQNIRDRFLATLRLDPRYEVIAYAIAYAISQDSTGGDAGLANGWNRLWILQEVRSWWSDGFGSTDVEFAALLDEMVGLGVLRVVQNSESEEKRYTLRNPNIRVLLGNKDTIEEALLKEGRELPALFEASLYHARYDGYHDPRKRGPLTSEYEGRLKRRGGVTVVSGVDATNIGEIGTFLEGRVDRGMYRELRPHTDAHQFERAITNLRPDPKRGTYIYLVPFATPWACRWLKLTVDALRRIKNGRYIRVVFVAKPDTLWTTMLDVGNELEGNAVDWMDLRPWSQSFIRQWCSDLNLHVDKEIEELVELSGRWPAVLEQHDVSVLPRPTRMAALRKLVNEERLSWLERLGISPNRSEHEIRRLVVNEVYTIEDVNILVRSINMGDEAKGMEDMLDVDTVTRRLSWMKRLSLLERQDSGHWSYNSLLKLLLTESGRG